MSNHDTPSRESPAAGVDVPAGTPEPPAQPAPGDSDPAGPVTFRAVAMLNPDLEPFIFLGF